MTTFTSNNSLFRDIDLDGPCRQLGVDHVGGPGADLALDGQDEFRAQHMSAFVRVGSHLRRENHLGQPETVAQVDENEPRRDHGGTARCS